jgi:phosphocarrier protein HPr
MAPLRCDREPCHETTVGETVPRPSAPLGRLSHSMTNDAPVARRQVEILNGWGLHMRPADKFVRIANGFASEVKVRVRGNEFSGKSILALAGLGADKGTVLEIEAHGPDAEAAVVALAGLVLARFYEDDEGQEIPQDTTPTRQDPAP